MNTNPHIIIEGSDRVGKTTVCALLSKKLKVPVIKMQDMPKFFKKNPEEASEIFNKTIMQFKDFGFVLDRGYPSSIVYSTYFNRQYDLKYLDKVIEVLQPQVFILNAKSREKDNLVSTKQQDELRNIYEVYAGLKGWTILQCDDLTPQQICNLIYGNIK